jgi:radical SAM protein with 4Fe4S-binding SPASM domain
MASRCGLIYEITSRCNLDCSFCYNVWHERKDHPIALSLEESFLMLSRVLSERNFSWLALSGGEPLLYPDLLALLHRLHEHFPALPLGLATNGTLLTEVLLQDLIKAGLNYCEVSLHSVQAADFKELTGRDKLAQVRCAIALIKKYHLPLTVACILTAKNAAALTPLMEIAFALGADQFTLNRFVPSGRGRQNRFSLDLSDAQFAELLARADAKAAELPLPVAVTIPAEDCLFPNSSFPHLKFNPCTCAEGKWVIDPAGNLRCCEQDVRCLGNLRASSFSVLTKMPSVASFRNRHRFGARCATCGALSVCGGGCRVLAQVRGSGA